MEGGRKKQTAILKGESAKKSCFDLVYLVLLHVMEAPVLVLKFCVLVIGPVLYGSVSPAVTCIKS